MTTLSPLSERHVAGPTRFEIRVQRDGEVVYVEPAGELDLSTSATLRNRVDALMATDAQQVIIDLRRLAFIDCAGVRACGRYSRLMATHGATERSCRSSKATRRCAGSSPSPPPSTRCHSPRRCDHDPACLRAQQRQDRHAT